MTMHLLTANIAGSIRRETLGGREHIVAPMTLIVPGVLVGNQGPILYTLEEITRSVDAWNGMPIILRHPYKAGKPISARQPEVLNKQQLGTVLNANVNGKLTAEGWFDVEKTRELSEEVYNALIREEEMEVSTGLRMAVKDESGVHNSKDYHAVGADFRPDHLAILPNETGACSLADGCGLNVNADGTQEPYHKVVNETSHDDIRSQLSNELQQRFGNEMETFVMDVYKKEFVYHRNGKLFRLPYSMNKGTAKVADTAPEEVQRVTSYQATNNSKEDEMPNGKLTDNERKDLVDKIIANGCSCFEEGEREILNGFSDSKLQSILNREKELVANAKKEAEKAGKTEPEPTPEPKKLTEDEWMANAPDSVRRVVNSAVAWETQQKEKYAAVIVANEKFKGYTKEVLMAKDLPELELLANAAAPEQKEQQPQPHYMGAATAFNAQPDKDELDQDDVLPMPVMNEAELASEALRKAVS